LEDVAWGFVTGTRGGFGDVEPLLLSTGVDPLGFFLEKSGIALFPLFFISPP
jgi:hypothetical protein